MDMISNIFNNCDPLKSPPEGAYVDLSRERGDSAIVSTLARRIRRSATPTHLLFSGHTGSGKSTQLLKLCGELKDPANSSFDRLFPIYIDADNHMTVNDAQVMEILLGIVAAAAQSLRDEEKIELESSYFQSRWDELKKFLFTDVELEKIDFSLPKIGTLTTRLKKADEDVRGKVRQSLAPQLPSILDEINIVLDKARDELKEKGYADIVLVVDNLEKIRDVPDRVAGRSTHYWIFIAGGDQLASIGAHTVYTIPLSLIRSPQQAALLEIFGDFPSVLPMVKIEEKDGTQYEKGIELMRDVLRRRFKISGLRETEVFDSPATFTYLCRKSGGHVRHLLMYFRTALDYVTDSLPLTKDAAVQGIQKIVSVRDSSIDEGHWKLLARLHRNPDKSISNDEEHQKMLEYLTILEYREGTKQPWYAVAPIVRELDKFKNAVKEIDKAEADETDETEPITGEE